MSLSSSQRIGWIGTGIMGAPLCEHLFKAGYTLTVHTRTPSKAESLIQQGVKWADSPSELIKDMNIVFTMVGFPTEVKTLYLNPQGLLAHATAGQIFVDMTTSDPELARELTHVAQSRKVFVLDAPVSGGDVGARNGTLSIMVGGNAAAFGTVAPILSVFAKSLVYQGGAGCGQHAKLCNQITIAGTMIGVCEALLYAHRAGLEGETLLRAIRTGAAGCWTLEYLAPRILQRDFAPGFFVEHFIKDMGIALKEANRMGLLLPGLALVQKLYLTIQSHGHGRSGTHALLLALEELSPTFLAADFHHHSL